jgi:hypothetical protein
MGASFSHLLSASAALALAGCSAILGMDPPELGADAAAATPDTSTSSDAAGYRATAVHFAEASNDYMTTNGLRNTSASPMGTYSVWLHFHGGDGQQQLISVAQIVGIGGVIRTSSNHIQFVMQMCSSPVVLDMQTQRTYTSTSGWIHVLASWDVSSGRAQIYVDDVVDRAANPTINNGNICYGTPTWGIGGLSSGQLDADVADLYASLGTSIDLDVEANRRLFGTAGNKPVDLGSNCTNPTHAMPTACFTGAMGSWNTNKGVGAGFTVGGDGLTAAQTSPSD